MGDISKRVDEYLDSVKASYQISRGWIVAIILFPLVIDFFTLLFLRVHASRPMARWMLDENHPVELLTFLFLMLATVWAVALYRQTKRNNASLWVSGFYALFALGVFLVGMEEISWGQQFFKFKTSGIFDEVNMQHEINVHNIGVLHGNSAYFRIFFGLCGLLGVWLSYRNVWPEITPPMILLTWFLVITFFAALGIYKNLSGDTRLYYTFLLRDLSELNEMLIGLSAFLFVWLNKRRLSANRL